MRKKLLLAMLTALIMAFTMCACGSSSESSDSSDDTATLTPMDGAYSMDDLSDCTVYASFTTDDFDWDTNSIYATIYDVVTYDTVDVNNLKEGDSIDTGDGTVEVKSIKEDGDSYIINEGEKNELTLSAGDGGTYEIVGDDDIRAMRMLGQAQITMADDVVLHDCTDDPDETVDISADKLQSYIESLKDDKANFSENDTTIVIEKDKATEITRAWRP